MRQQDVQEIITEQKWLPDYDVIWKRWMKFMRDTNKTASISAFFVTHKRSIMSLDKISFKSRGYSFWAFILPLNRSFRSSSSKSVISRDAKFRSNDLIRSQLLNTLLREQKQREVDKL